MGGKEGMLRYADGVDKLLMVFGTFGCIGDGLQIPLMMFALSYVINDYGSFGTKVSIHVVNKYALRLLYIAIGVGLSAFVEGFCWARTAERQASRMRLEYLKAILRQEVGFFDTQTAESSRTYQVVSIISSDSNSIQIAIGEKIPNCLTLLSSLCFCMIFAFVLSWKITLASIPFTIVFIAPGLGFGKLMMDVGLKMSESYGVAGGIVEQAISSIRTVYSYVGEHQTLDRFSHALQKTMELGIKQGFARGLMMGSMGVIYVRGAFQAWFGSVLVTEKGERGGDVFVAGFNVFMGGLNILTALPNLTFITEAKVVATRISEMVDRLPAIDTEEKKGKALSYVRGEIEFKELYFSYPSRPDTPILQGLNLRVPAGETVGLVGGSGSGKSTIISLLQRFYDPTEGEILLDGYKMNRVRLKWLRSQMGLVNQEPVLFATSIKENILFGKEGASVEELEGAAKAANAHDFISKLPDGYETQVGQFGIQLSGGQKQRIAIARALIRDPKILLLDEATSALDAVSERTVQEAIDQASVGRTTIVIAHRLSTIRMANMIVVLQSGKVVESGSHDELMQINSGQGGEYFRMVQLQQSTMLNEASIESDCQVDGTSHYNHGVPLSLNNRSHYHMVCPPSPISVRSTNGRIDYTMSAPPTPLNGRLSAPSTPVLHPFSMVYSMSPPHSVEFEASYESDDENLMQQSSPPSPWRLLKMNAPEWGRALLGCIGAIGSGAVQPINSYCVGALISVYFKNDKSSIKSEARYYSLIFLGLGVFNFVTSLLQHYNFAIMGENLTRRVREKLLEKLMTFEIGWFDHDENTSAAICARLSTEANMVRSLVGDRISLLSQAFFSAIFAYALGLALTWRLALVLIGVQPLLIGSFYSKSFLFKSMSEKIQKAQQEGSQLASETVINHRTITAFSSQKRILKLFRATLEGPRKESVKQSWFSGIGLFCSQFLAAASTALAYWYGGKLLTEGLITPENLFRTFFLLLFTAYTIAEAGSMTKDLSRGSNAVRSIFSILDRNSEIDPDNTRGFNANKLLVKGSVELKNVVFAYPSRPNQLIFKGLSLKIAAGSSVALVGQSGSGKSTILGLIERFYDPMKGSVYIDGRDIKEYHLRSLRSQIALVSQEPTLFAGTIHENIAYGKNDAKESEIMEAAMLANAHEFISGMKDGYATYCGERGVQLSGGQKQRIALARAILKSPSILLLDEATSALDSVSEKLVQDALEKMMSGRTCIVVAHRLSTVQNSNSIVVIKDGTVVEQGSHSDLLCLGPNGVYYSLVQP